MARPSSLPLVDRLLDGALRTELEGRRAAGDSYAAISRWFLLDHDLTIAPETVRKWCGTLGIEKPEPEAATA